MSDDRDYPDELPPEWPEGIVGAEDQGVRVFWLAADSNRNGMMEAGEPLVEFVLHSQFRQVETTIYQYVPLVFTGDPLADSNGFTDGFDLPGSAGAVAAWPAPPASGRTRRSPCTRGS